MARLGAIVGLPIEASLLRHRGRDILAAPELIAIARADAARAEVLAGDLVARGAKMLLSFGIAGGAHPMHRPGAIVVATQIVLPDGRRMPTSTSWRRAVLRQAIGLDLHEAPIGGSDRMVATLADKQQWASQGVAAVDMESHGVARAALRLGVPLLAIRAIADPADQALPRAAMAGLSADGTVRPLRVLAVLLREPRQIGQLLGVSANTVAALTALWRVAGAVNAPE